MQLPDHILQKLTEIFAHVDDIEEVILYGSRAKENAKEGSDIDLAIKGLKDLQGIRKLEIQIDNLELPWEFDLTNYSSISNIELINHIDRVGVSIYQKVQS